MNEKIKQYELRLFNKLFSTLPAVKRMNGDKSILNINKPITHLYFFHNKKFWFAKGETDEKFYYIFGKNPKESDIGETDATIIIDFDKNYQFNENNLGLFSLKNSEIHILINDNLLNHRYPYFNTGNFKINEFKSIDGKINLNVIDLGGLNSDFIENIEKFIELSPKINRKTQENIINEILTSKNENPKVDINPKSYTDETAEMNLFINALESGKTHKEAYKIAKIDNQIVERWYDLGKRGDEKYIYFYKKYKPLNPENQERQKKMQIFLDSLKYDRNIDNALAKSDLKISKVRAWYSLGEKGSEDYKNFYKACKILLPNGIPKKETKKIVNNEELMNEFIALIDDGKTNDEAIKQLKIPKFKVKNWVNQGKLGNKKYVNFYNAYMVEIENKKQLKAKKQELVKKHEQQEEKNKQISKKTSEDTTSKTNENICKICGRKLNTKTKKDICKRCSRKQYASKILLKLLKSIEPEKPFKKEDLKVLGLQNIQITDYIWTLQEFNLVSEQNNKLILKNRNELNTFIEESGLDVEEIPQEQTSVKLNKKCKICGETLEISKFFTSDLTEDGFEDNCKDCKRLITTASYLNEIINFVEYENEFSEDELKPYFKSPFQLQAKIWALLDNDLVKKNFETNKYTLTDEKTAKEFLDKYLIEKEDEKPHVLKKSDDNNPQKNAKEEQMKVILKALSEGKSRKEASEIANVPLYKITHWYNEGKQGYGADNVNFYKQINDYEKINDSKNIELKDKMNQVLDELKIKKNISKVTTTNEIEIKDWIEKGKHDVEPYDYFYDAYRNIIDNNLENEKQEYENKAINRKIFLENFKSGKTKEESAEYADLELSLVHEWYLKGRDNEEPYNGFYEKYMEIKNNDEEKETPQIVTDLPGTEIVVRQMNLILESLANNMSEEEAIQNSNISENTYKYWLNRGKQEFGELYTEFYKYVTKIKNNKLKISEETSTNNITDETKLYTKMEEKLKKILSPLPKEYEELFKSSKMSISGFAWVTKNLNQWIYTKWRDGKQISIASVDLFELYDKVTSKNLIWGVRDLELACNSLNIPLKKANELLNRKIIYDSILTPLPEEYEDSFKSTKINKTGIAWVNKTGSQWTYSRQINGKSLNITAPTLNELHEKVINNNLVWGIRDYKKASKFIDIPSGFDPNKLEIKPIEPKPIDYSNIYQPLPKEHENSFKSSKSNQTGIAWVNKIGNRWIYSRSINGKQVEITDYDIYGLYEKVINNNLVWGIRDYKKAKEIIEIPDNFEIPRNAKRETKDNLNIYSPLPEEYLSKFNPKQNNKTGIAWVNKYGLNWVYNRQINGKTIKFQDPDIHKLYDKVIENNQIWGIIDYEKAQLIIEPECFEEKEYDSSEGYNKVTVNYIDKPKNNADILIKGLIKNTELFEILNKLKIFEKNIKRIMSTSVNNELDIFIELEINKYFIPTFEEKIQSLNWKINK